MSYHEQGIQELSPSQISKLLNGHAVRVRRGSHHAIHLTEEHSKKLHRAHAKGKGITIRLDPYAIQGNQHLRNAINHAVQRTQRGGKVGTDLTKHLAINTAQLSDAGTNYLIGQMGGNLKRHRGRPRKIYTSGMHGGDGRGYGEARRQDAERNRVLEHGSPIARTGGKLSNKLKHAQQVMDFLGHNYQGIAHAVKPVAKPIFGALTTKAVNYINPLGQLESAGESIKHLFGGAVRKRGRPHKIHGGAAGPAGYGPYY